MQGLRYKFGDRRNEWKCCFCCHVRTGTIFLGIWHLMLQVLAMSMLLVLFRHPELMVEEDAAPALPTPLSEVDPPRVMQTMDSNESIEDIMNGRTPVQKMFVPNSYKAMLKKRVEYQDLHLAVVITFCTFAITLLMVYGAIKGKPAYLMPFFCMQVFDFCIASLSALSYLCHFPNVHLLVAENSQIPMHAELLSLPPQCLSLLVLLTFVIAMLVKIYFIGVVWGCYKFLTLRIVSAQRTIQFIDTEFAESEGTLLPDYDTALKFPTPPPSYASATGEAVPPPAPSAQPQTNPPTSTPSQSA